LTKEEDFYINSAALIKYFYHREGCGMLKLRNFWSEYGEDTILASVLMTFFLGLFLLISYLLIYTL
jgi:hypothetical protein